jgi:hypothetical protein
MKSPTSMTVNFVTDRANRKNTIVYIMWNDWFVNSKKYKGNFDFANELMSFTNLTSNSNLHHNFDKIMTYDLEDAMELAYESGFSYAVVQTPGHMLLYGFRDAITDYIAAIDQDWAVMGHVLNFKKYNNWLTLHEQCFVLNLKHIQFAGKELGFANQGVRIFPDYDTSEENFHDDYTPKSVKFNEQYYKTGGYGLGWKWMSYGLLNNSIVTFNDNVRNKKVHLYPENEDNQQAWYNIDAASDDNQLKKIVKHFSVKDPKQHVYNNENVFSGLPHIITDKIDNIVVAASGFYGLQVSKLLDAKAVYYYDQDLALLQFRQQLNLNWNGIDPISNYYTPDMLVFDDTSLPKVEAIDRDIIKNQEDLLTYLKTFKTIPKFYKQVDIINDWEDFVSFVPENGATYIWLDSIYTYWYNIWNYRPRLIQKSFISLIYKLQERKDPVWINVKEPSGQFRIFEVHKYSPDALTMFFSRYEHFA